MRILQINMSYLCLCFVSLLAVGTSPLAAAAPQVKFFDAVVTGRQQAPFSIFTPARGMASFQLSSDGTQLAFRLIVLNIQDVTAVNIQLANTGETGPVVAWLYPNPAPDQTIVGPFDFVDEHGGLFLPAAPPIPGLFNGVLATGVITEADLVGSLAGQPLSALADHLVSRNGYVAFRTLQNPGGEIRGQIRYRRSLR